MSVILYFFYGVLIITSFRLGTWIILALAYNLKGNIKNLGAFPLISLIVPALNEGITFKSSLQLTAPSRPREISDTITLAFKEATEPVNQDISIPVSGGQ